MELLRDLRIGLGVRSVGEGDLVEGHGHCGILYLMFNKKYTVYDLNITYIMGTAPWAMGAPKL